MRSDAELIAHGAFDISDPCPDLNPRGSIGNSEKIRA